LLVRSYALDAISEALMWKQNPVRNEVLLAAKSILLSKRALSSSDRETSVVASERTELWEVLKPHLKNEDEQNELQQLAMANWNESNSNKETSL
jgi:hypothetical protein